MSEQAIEMHEMPAARPRLPHAFTRENAREMSKRGNEARRRKANDLRQREELSALTELNYNQRQLARTRVHIEKLHDKIASARDAKDIKFLADSLARLCELEAKLRAPSGPTAPIKRGALGSGPLES